MTSINIPKTPKAEDILIPPVSPNVRRPSDPRSQNADDQKPAERLTEGSNKSKMQNVIDQWLNSQSSIIDGQAEQNPNNNHNVLNRNSKDSTRIVSIKKILELASPDAKKRATQDRTLKSLK